MIVRVSGDPVPGITAGMVDGLKGMVAGGKRTLKVTPAAGFGGTTVVAPYAVGRASRSCRGCVWQSSFFE